MNILGIETSTDWLSLAVSTGGAVHERSLRAGHRHAELVMGEIDALLARAAIGVADLHAIAFGAGPGSFTGLRIACGVAQGIAVARGLPVLGVGTLAALAATAGAPRVVACLDARMLEVYHAAYAQRLDGLEEVIPPGLHRPGEVPLPEGEGWIGCGTGFGAHGAALAARYGGRLAAIRLEVFPSAAAVVRLAAPRFAAGEGSDPSAAAPIYLRDRVALRTDER